MNYELTDVLVFFAAVVVAIAFLIMLIMKFIISVYFPFVDEHEHIKSKIMFSGSHNEREYWIGERRRLYVSYIPIVGGFIASKMGKKKRKKH